MVMIIVISGVAMRNRKTRYEIELEDELISTAKQHRIDYTFHEKDFSLLAEKLNYFRNHPANSWNKESVVLEVINHVTQIDPERNWM